MARIEHRRRRRGFAGPGEGWRRMPVVGWPFVALAVVVGLVELVPVANAFWLGATEWWSELPPLLPVVARSSAMVLLPAAVAWGSPARYRANGWLWKGALIVALVQVARYPAGYLGNLVVQGLLDSGVDPSDPRWFAVNLAFGFLLAVLSVLGVWALAEGVKDAGGGSRAAVVLAAVVAVAMGLLYLVPSLMASPRVDLDLATGLLSVAVNVAYLYAHGLLFGRAVAGAVRRIRPARAWAVGAFGATALLLTPLISLSVQLVNFYVLPQGQGLVLTQLFVLLSFFGWPAVVLALGMGFARRTAPAPSPVGTGFVMHGRARFAAPA